MWMTRPKLWLPLLAVFAALATTPVYAHGVGDRYDLPLPLSYFAAGGAAAVVLSFVIIGLVVKRASRGVGYPRFNLFRYSRLESFVSGPILWPVKVLSVFLLGLVIATAFAGTSLPEGNFSPAFVWIIWWVGMGFVVALIGNLWALVNPWKISFTWLEAVYGLAFPGKRFGLGWELPARWGVWPAVVLFSCFAWVENAFADSANPRDLGWMVAAYSILIWLGMFAFGRREWLRRGEAFSVVFGLLARFSMTEVRVPSADQCRQCPAKDCRNDDGECIECYDCFETAGEREFNVRPPGVGLGNIAIIDRSMVALVMLVLASVTFDGFSATPEWFNVETFFFERFPGLTYKFLNGVLIANTLGLIVFPLGFLGVYWVFCRLMAQSAGEGPPAGDLMAGYVLTLIPIALAYHYAHYLGYLLIQGQSIVPLASDPFGFGWDLFGSAGYETDIGVVNARFIWVFSVLAIVAGHIIAVFLAHIRAVRYYPTRAVLMNSQLPMLGLMVLYTVVSLWIVSRPITE